MNKIKILLLLLLSNSLFSEVLIGNIGLREGSLKFNETVLNKKISITPGCKPVKEIFKEIDEKVGYSIINKTNLDYESPICSGYKFNYLGDLLNAIVGDMEVVFHEEANQRILLEYATEHSVKLPMNWDVEKTIKHLLKKYPNIKTYTFGHTIRMIGGSKEMKEASETLDRIKNWAKRSLPFNIRVSKLKTKYKHNKTTIISKIPKKDVKIKKVRVEHASHIPLPNVGTLVFDLQKNRVVLNKKFIKFKEINSYSFFKSGYQVSFNTPFGAYSY